MDPEFENCLKKGKIRVFSRGKALGDKELSTARSDLEEAQAIQPYKSPLNPIQSPAKPII